MKKFFKLKTHLRITSLVILIAAFSMSAKISPLGAQCVLSMEDLIHISLSEECADTLTPEMFITDYCCGGQIPSCPDAFSFEFEVTDAYGVVLIPKGDPPIIGYDYVGGQFMLTIWVYDIGGKLLNSGMSLFTVSDKMAPKWVDCPSDTIDLWCFHQDIYIPDYYDNCTPDSLIQITMVDEDITENNCNYGWDPEVLRVIERTYLAKDASGNLSDSCKVIIKINTLTDHQFNHWIHFPISLDLSCIEEDDFKNEEGVFDPDTTGWPFLIFPKYPGSMELDTAYIKNDCIGPVCNLYVFYTDIELDYCPDCSKKTMRTWTVIDHSCMARTRMGIQFINVYDHIPPVIVCPYTDTITITTNAKGTAWNGFEAYTCGAMYKFQPPKSITDLCNPEGLSYTITVTNNGAIIHEIDADVTGTGNPIVRFLPLGKNRIIYTAYDKCGNSSYCEYWVKIVDNTPPVAVCQQFTTVSLTYGGEAYVFPNSFDSGSYDDCGLDSMKVRRMDDLIDCDGTIGPEGHFYDYVKFCCSDIPENNVIVVLRVWDTSGNFNECMVEVNVQDKLPPLIQCPPDLCVECDYQIDLEHMDTYFGTVAHGWDNIKSRSIGNSYAAFYNRTGEGYCYGDAPVLNFQDGWAVDNCNLRIEHSYIDDRDMCGVGNIVRTFTASDHNGEVQCTQIIHFRDPGPYDVEITWPPDVTLTTCTGTINTHPDNTGYPTMKYKECHVLGTNYTDEVHYMNPGTNNPESVCYKIIRKWSVLDWCQKVDGVYVPWIHDQIIKVIETEAPVFTTPCENKEVCTYDSECKDGYIELTMTAEDNCTDVQNLKWRYQIDFNKKGSFDIDSKNFSFPLNNITGPAVDASGTYPIGTHRIVYTVWDQCGNKTTCSHDFTIKNCKKPTPICVDNIVVVLMPVDTTGDGIADWAMIDLPANVTEHCTDCVPASFHPCGYPVVYSFSADTTDKVRTFTCENIGLYPVEMWVTAILPDGTITQDYCSTFIHFQDNSGVCDDYRTPLDIQGTVKTITEEPVKDVSIIVLGSETGPHMTNADGNFMFTVMSDAEYTIIPDKYGDDLNGITTLDLVLIQKHILGLKDFADPFMYLAANANFDNRVSAADILLLRRLILGETDKLDKSWKFIPRDHEFTNPVNPLSETLPGSVTINPYEDMTVDFYGIKVGDINFSYIEPRSSQNLLLAVDALNILPGSIQIPVFAASLNDIEGFQFTLEFDKDILSFMELEPVALNSISSSNIGLRRSDEGLITLSWNRVGKEYVDASAPLFILHFNASSTADIKNAISLTSSITGKEAYNSDLEVMGVELQFRNDTREFSLFQNSPNPFSEYTFINFYLPESTNAKLTISDVSGRIIMVREGEFFKGMNSVRIDKNDISTSGVLYYRLDTGTNSATRKMILIK